MARCSFKSVIEEFETTISIVDEKKLKLVKKNNKLFL